jgi:hypothetical protein
MHLQKLLKALYKNALHGPKNQARVGKHGIMLIVILD